MGEGGGNAGKVGPTALLGGKMQGRWACHLHLADGVHSAHVEVRPGSGLQGPTATPRLHQAYTGRVLRQYGKKDGRVFLGSRLSWFHYVDGTDLQRIGDLDYLHFIKPTESERQNI